MNLPIRRHYADNDGNPSGGISMDTGFIIVWQDGPLVIDGERKEPNGAFVENVIEAALDRLEVYQQTKFKNDYNATAIHHLNQALEALHQRTADREKRGVEGTHEL